MLQAPETSAIVGNGSASAAMGRALRSPSSGLGHDRDGLVVYELKHLFRDGTTPVLFEPVGHHRSPQLHGCRALETISCGFTACSPPTRVVTAASSLRRRPSPCAMAPSRSRPPHPRPDERQAQRLRLVFDIDIGRWPRCGARIQVLALITDPRGVVTILTRLDTRAARTPPPVPTLTALGASERRCLLKAPGCPCSCNLLGRLHAPSATVTPPSPPPPPSTGCARAN